VSTFKTSVGFLVLLFLELLVVSVFALLQAWEGHLILPQQNMRKDTANAFFVG